MFGTFSFGKHSICLKFGKNDIEYCNVFFLQKTSYKCCTYCYSKICSGHMTIQNFFRVRPGGRSRSLSPPRSSKPHCATFQDDRGRERVKARRFGLFQISCFDRWFYVVIVGWINFASVCCQWFTDRVER